MTEIREIVAHTLVRWQAAHGPAASITDAILAALAERGYAVVREGDCDRRYLERLADQYCYVQGGGAAWTEAEAKAICLTLQFMALSVTDVDGWRAAVEARRAMIRATLKGYE